MKLCLKKMALAAVAIEVSACGGGVGPGEAALIGSWEQVGTTEMNPEIRLRDIRITYDRDGTSDYSATMLMGAPGEPTQQYSVTADVDWTLQETVITRTLRSVEATPADPSPESEAFADGIEAAYMQTPPVNLIIQSLTDTELVLLDPETGQVQSYRRS